MVLINFNTETNELMLIFVEEVIKMPDINLLLTIQRKEDVDKLNLTLNLLGNNFKADYKSIELYEVI